MSPTPLPDYKPRRKGVAPRFESLFARLTRATRRREKRWFRHLRRQMGLMALKGWDMEDRRAD